MPSSNAQGSNQPRPAARRETKASLKALLAEERAKAASARALAREWKARAEEAEVRLAEAYGMATESIAMSAAVAVAASLEETYNSQMMIAALLLCSRR